jgi:STE24 endopeptidase
MFVIWLAWKPGSSYPTSLGTRAGLALFLGVYALLVLGTGLWSRLLTDRLSSPGFNRGLSRLNRIMFVARLFVPLWFIVGMFVLGWADFVNSILNRPGLDWTQTTVGVVLGTLPALVAWAGLWWSQFPAEIALRELSISSYLQDDLPVHKPPTFSGYFGANIRLQLLFLVVPVVLIALLHDSIRLLATVAVGSRWDFNSADNPFTWLLAAGMVFFFAPEVLRRVLYTEPLPQSSLRRRLESLCHRTGVRYREILLWRTENNLGNAAVMGFVPRFRYILLSDLLLETMTDEQIEAVFAHELGHVVHRHMAWFVVFFMVLSMFFAGVSSVIRPWTTQLGIADGPIEGVLLAGAYMAKFVLVFGWISRRFERQADVFAARTMEMTHGGVIGSTPVQELAAVGQLALVAEGIIQAPPLTIPSRIPFSEAGFVGRYGATVFGSALQRVAIMNNIPVRARSWCHGSIASRMQYLRELSSDPARTERFDRLMLVIYGMLVFGLFAGAAFCWASSAFS